MIVSEAIRRRLKELLDERHLTPYKLSFLSGISTSVVSDCLREKVKEPTISSIIHMCEGLGIQLSEFFDSPYFYDVEAVEKLDPRNKSKKKI